MIGVNIQAGFSAGYDTAQLFIEKLKKPVDADYIFIHATKYDRRIPKPMKEGDPGFWGWYWCVCEGIAQYAKDNGVRISGVDSPGRKMPERVKSDAEIDAEESAYGNRSAASKIIRLAYCLDDNSTEQAALLSLLK
jgi:hypothetical protein